MLELILHCTLSAQVDLDIGGRSVQFEIDTAVSSSIGEQATKFCTSYGAEFGVTQETLGECTQNVVQALEGKVAAAVAEKGLTPVAQQQQQQEVQEEAVPSFQVPLFFIGVNMNNDI